MSGESYTAAPAGGIEQVHTVTLSVGTERAADFSAARRHSQKLPFFLTLRSKPRG